MSQQAQQLYDQVRPANSPVWRELPHEEQAVWERVIDLHFPFDDPDTDSTDYAHPAWWRAHEQTTQVFCDLVTKILDGNDNGGGANHEPWQTLRRRLLAMVAR